MILLVTSFILSTTLTVEQIPPKPQRGDLVLFRTQPDQSQCNLRTQETLFHQIDPQTFVTVFPVSEDGSARPRKVSIEVNCNGKRGALTVTPANPERKMTRIRVSPKKLRWPPDVQALMESQRREWVHYLSWIFPTFIRTPTPVDFEFPVKNGKVSSLFFSPRTYNDGKTRRHWGTDIAAADGTPLVAPLDGIVVLSQEHYLKGRVLMLHHGGGLVTSYFHLSDIQVEPGQWIDKGSLLGKTGRSGRVTGPHLHWEAYWYGQAFNALSLANLASPQRMERSIVLTHQENVGTLE